RMLMGLGFTPLEARNGLEAVELYGSYRSGIALVVTDVDMPVMDGLEAIDRMRELSPGVRVLVMTGTGRDLNVPGCQLLRKPFSLAQLSEQVGRALA
ncbi:MAG TPA: response regulator, partial [Bryobacteraceae bacterium]|nr:response regulator [Bryobacteraceae bacterium]